MEWKGTRKRAIVWIVLAVVAEVIIILWPLLCACMEIGIWFWTPFAEDSRDIAFGVAFGVAFGLVLGVSIGLSGDLSDGLTFGLAFSFAFGLTLGVAFGPAGGVALCITFGLALGLAFSPYSDIAFNLILGLAGGLTSVITVGITLGFTSGLALGLAFLLSYGFAVLLVYASNQLLKGARQTISGFFRPWKLKNYPFGRAVAFWLAAYILVALVFFCWFYACHLEGIEELPPKKPFFNTQDAGRWGFVYFSFITITSLGYGDICPTHPFTQFLVVLETIVGIGLVAGFLAMILKVAGERTQKQTRTTYIRIMGQRRSRKRRNFRRR